MEGWGLGNVDDSLLELFQGRPRFATRLAEALLQSHSQTGYDLEDYVALKMEDFISDLSKVMSNSSDVPSDFN